MARVKLSPILEELHGKVGHMVFRRTRNGGVSLIRRADMSNVKWSPAQAAHRRRFRVAVAYARRALADPAQRKRYEKAGARKGRRAFEMAVSEFFKTKPK